MADAATKGMLRGRTVTLDEPVPGLDGRRVHVILEPADDEVELRPDEQAAAWREWVEHGPQGPIDEGETPELP
jgi:hypothetical protein